MSGTNTNSLTSPLEKPALEQWWKAHPDGRFEFAEAEADRVDSASHKDTPLLEHQIRLWASTKTIAVAVGSDDAGHKLYKPILDSYEIRVLELKPGARDASLQGSLRHCSLEFATLETECMWQTGAGVTPIGFAVSMDNLKTPIRYTALSYTWGTTTFDAKIYCDGCEKAITMPLELALRQFRREDRSIFMWIDQICIDQENNVEKERQIPLMGCIYSSAFNTVIWLGEATPGVESATQLLEDVRDRLQFSQGDIGPSDFERLLLPAPDAVVWRALWDLLERPWFRRLWVIQEVILSRDAWVACGDSLTSWATLDTACIYLTTCGISRWLQQRFPHPANNPSPGNRAAEDGLQSACQLGWLKPSHNLAKHKLPLFELLVGARNAQCYDPRDRIYGLLGVCGDADRGAIRTSYAKDRTAPLLYHELTIHALNSEKKGMRLTKILTCVDQNSSALPSWVPDWGQPRETESLGYSSSIESVYCPSGESTVSGKLYHSIGGKSSNELHVRGLSVDIVRKTSTVFLDPDLTYSDSRTENKALVEAYNFVSSNLQSLSGLSDDKVFPAFWHTLVASQDATGKLKCPDSFAEIFSLLLDELTGRCPSLPGQTYSARQLRPEGKGRLEVSHLASRTVGETFREVQTALKRVVRNRRLGITERGRLGLFPRQCREGDEVCVLDGCHVPFLLRSAEGGGGRHRLVGECYVYGIMHGEAVGRERGGWEEVVMV